MIKYCQVKYTTVRLIWDDQASTCSASVPFTPAADSVLSNSNFLSYCTTNTIGLLRLFETLNVVINCSDVQKKPQRPVPKKKPKLVLQDGKMTPVTAE